MKPFLRLLAVLSALFLAPAAFAQSTATPVVPGTLQAGICPSGITTCFTAGTPLTPLQVMATTFSSVGSGTLSASTTTSNTALPAQGTIVEVANGGSVTAYFNLGGSTVTAKTSNFALPAGQTVFVYAGTSTYIAGITGSSTATLTITVGNAAAVGGGSGGSVTQGTVPWVVGGLTGVGQDGAITRAANTTAYAANEIICASTVSDCSPIQVTIAGANAATGTMGRVLLVKNGSGLTNATFTIYFFSAAPTLTGVHDASAYVGPIYDDIFNYLGSYTCNAMQATNDSAAAFSECVPTAPQGWMQYQTLSGEEYVDAVIVATGAYTPANGETFTIIANSYQDH